MIIKWISNIKEVHSKPTLHVLSTYYLEYDCHVAELRRRRAYAPTNNNASHDNHEKTLSFLYEYGAPLGGNSVRRRSANIFTFNLPTNKKHSVLKMGDYWSLNHNGDFKLIFFLFLSRNHFSKGSVCLSVSEPFLCLIKRQEPLSFVFR